jgi:hypothetical protein
MYNLPFIEAGVTLRTGQTGKETEKENKQAKKKKRLLNENSAILA